MSNGPEEIQRREAEVCKLYTDLNRKPMYALEGGREVLPRVGTVENPGSKILPILEPVQGFEWDPDRTQLQ